MTFIPDCFSIILLDIDGSLVLVSCTTISVYVNLSKNVLPTEPCLSQPTSARECLSHLRVQRYNFSENYQNILLLFSTKRLFLRIIHYYIIYARVKETGQFGVWHTQRIFGRIGTKMTPDQKTGTGMSLKKVKVFLLRSKKFGGDWNNSYLCNYFYNKLILFV